jgi:hypothetical protein
LTAAVLVIGPQIVPVGVFELSSSIFRSDHAM